MIDDALHMKYIPASKTNLYFNPDMSLEAMRGYPGIALSYWKIRVQIKKEVSNHVPILR
jgi:hypothetical protein